MLVYFMGNPTKMDDLGGTPILGNYHVCLVRDSLGTQDFESLLFSVRWYLWTPEFRTRGLQIDHCLNLEPGFLHSL